MRIVITHLKAPWPEGAKAGDIIDIGDVIPAWAVGKCNEVAESIERQFVVNPAEVEPAPKKAKGVK